MPTDHALLELVLQQQRRENRRMLDMFKRGGDIAPEKRWVSHSALLGDEAAAARVRAAFERTGYSTKVAPRPGGGWAVLFAREDALTPDNVEQFSSEAVRAVMQEGGQYEGWTSFLVRVPSAR